MCSCRLGWSCNFLVAALWSAVVVVVVIVVVLIIVILCNVFCFPKSSNSARLPQFGKLTTSKQFFQYVTKRQSNFVTPGLIQKWNVLYTICYILSDICISILYLYIRYNISNLILRISHPASDFMLCLLIIIVIVYLFWRDCNNNYSNCSRTLQIVNLIFFCFSFFIFLVLFFVFLLFFAFWFAFFFGLLFCFTFFHIFFTNKLIFKFIGFWPTGEHNTIAALMRPLQDDLPCPAAKDDSITMYYARSRGAKQPWRSHYNAICKDGVAKHNRNSRNGIRNCSSKTGSRRQSKKKDDFEALFKRIF